MKTLLWAVVVYQAAVGFAELAWVATSSPSLAGVAALPSVASAVDTQITAVAGTSTNTVEGLLDVSIAAAVWWVGLR